MAPIYMPREHHFRVLGLPSTASQDEIRSAYKALVLRWHPDRQTNKELAKEKFVEIHNAYQALLGTRPGYSSRTASSSSETPSSPPSSPFSQTTSFYSQSSHGSYTSQSSFASSTSRTSCDSLDVNTTKQTRFKTKKSRHFKDTQVSESNQANCEADTVPQPRRSRQSEVSESSRRHRTGKGEQPQPTEHGENKSKNRHRESHSHSHTPRSSHSQPQSKSYSRSNTHSHSYSHSTSHEYSSHERSSHSHSKRPSRSHRHHSRQYSDHHHRRHSKCHEPEDPEATAVEPDTEVEEEEDEEKETEEKQQPPIIGIPLRPNRFPGLSSPDWIFPMPLTLEEMYSGTSYRFQITRQLNDDKGSDVNSSLHVDVEIPPGGYKNGTEIRFGGIGNQRKDGSFQDIVFVVQEVLHDRFARLGNDLHARIEVISEGDLESEEIIFIEGLDGEKVAVPIPMGVETRVPKAGMPIRNAQGRNIGRGDMVVRWEFANNGSSSDIPRTKWQALKSRFSWHQTKPSGTEQ